MARRTLQTLGLVVAVAASGYGKSEPLGQAQRSTAEASSRHDEICRTMSRAAAENSLPLDFFANVIWQESQLDPDARSSAGAQGIAQFMPKTASSRGLLNPFNPVAALWEAASYLRELRTTFGNLGLAAAAYNAGPGRVTRWLAKKGQLPKETLRYVEAVTGQSITNWSTGEQTWAVKGVPSVVACPWDQEPSEVRETAALPISTNWLPWGAQLAGDWKEGKVLATYEKLRRRHLDVLGEKNPFVTAVYGPSGMSKRFVVRVATTTQDDAEALCARLRTEAVSCFAVRNKTDDEVTAEARRYARLISYRRPSASPAARTAQLP